MGNLGVHKCSNHTQKITGYKKRHSAWQRDDKLQVDHLTQRNPQKRWERLESLLEFGQLSQAGTSNRAAEEDLHLLSYLKLYEEKVRVSDSGGQSLWFRPSFLWCGILYVLSAAAKYYMRVREETSNFFIVMFVKDEATHFKQFNKKNPWSGDLSPHAGFSSWQM